MAALAPMVWLKFVAASMAVVMFIGLLLVVLAFDGDAKVATGMFFRVGLALAGLIAALVALISHRLLRQRADAMRESQYHMWLANRIFEFTLNSVVVVDRNGNIVRVNPAFTQMTGYSQDEVLGRKPSLLNSGRQSTAFYADMWQQLQATGRWQGDVWNRRKSGDLYLESISASAIHDRHGHYSHYMLVGNDATHRQQAEERLLYLATHDALTGVVNRTLFGERLQQAITKARRTRLQVAVLFLDLDGFKQINDNLGHSVGDEVLKTVAERIGDSLRESDTVARLGGDEFAVILEDIRDADDVISIAETLKRALAVPIEFTEQWVSVTASVGISLYPDHERDPRQLVDQADRAMYEAKMAGKNRFRFHAA